MDVDRSWLPRAADDRDALPRSRGLSWLMSIRAYRRRLMATSRVGLAFDTRGEVPSSSASVKALRPLRGAQKNARP
jgi:hypothetical protein